MPLSIWSHDYNKHMSYGEDICFLKVRHGARRRRKRKDVQASSGGLAG